PLALDYRYGPGTFTTRTRQFCNAIGMGALDDAIRDHLELKRKHGASEEEIREREREALGPGGPAFEALGTKPQPEPASELPGAQTESQALEDELLEEMEAVDGAAAAVEAPATSGN